MKTGKEKLDALQKKAIAQDTSQASCEEELNLAGTSSEIVKDRTEVAKSISDAALKKVKNTAEEDKKYIFKCNSCQYDHPYDIADYDETCPLMCPICEGSGNLIVDVEILDELDSILDLPSENLKFLPQKNIAEEAAELQNNKTFIGNSHDSIEKLQEKPLKTIEEVTEDDKTDTNDDSVVSPLPVETEETKPENDNAPTEELDEIIKPTFKQLMKQLETLLKENEVLKGFYLKLMVDPLKKNKYILYHRAPSNRAATIYENKYIVFYKTSVKKALSRNIEKDSPLWEFMKGSLYEEC